MKPLTHPGFHATLIAAAALALPAAAQTVTVTTLEDVTDFAGAQQVGDLPGPDGLVSFREAVLAANNTAGPQTIAFAIPAAEWWMFGDRAMLKLENGAFVVNGDETFIDFSTQTEFSGDTNPAGGEVGIYGLEANGWGTAAIFINADGCTIKGLDAVMQRGYGASISGDNNRVIGSTISGPIHAAVEVAGWFGGPVAENNVIGGVAPGEGNVLSGGGSGVRIAAPAENNVVIGNQITGGDIGVWMLGSIYSTTVNNNRIGGPTPQERNLIAGAGSYCCEGAPDGGQVMVEYGEGNVIEGNYIGTTADGLGGASQVGPHGIRLFNSSNNVVRNNVIGDIIAIGFNHHAGERFGVGIEVLGDSDGNVIQGNLIGVGADGVTPIPNHRGIVVAQFPAADVPDDNLIGGPGQGNVIAYSELNGIEVAYAVSGATILDNSIHDNDELGIDLLSPFGGVTPNDAGDTDVGGNGLQNFPVLTSAQANGVTVTIQGSLDSAAGAGYTVELFANPACDPSGFGEGAVVLGSVPVTTDALGHAEFVVTLGADVAEGDAITATATADATGNTSEFSACLGATAGSMPGDVDGDGVVGVLDFLAVLGNWGPCAESCPPSCDADLDADCEVGITDFLMVLGNWT